MAYIFQRLKRFCCFIAGFVFFISGILKLLDPVGAGLVMDEYFSFLHIGFLSFASKAAGTAFALAEAILGAAMVTGVWRRSTAIAAFIFQGFFTVLTLILVIFNPEMDCGCFGEAIHLTHWQTFLKNIALIILLLTAYIPMGSLGEPKSRKYVSFSLVVLSVVAFTLYSLLYIPMMDFTEYKPGAVLRSAKASVPEGDMYEAVFIYEKDGRQESFTLQHLPDSTWNFVSTETVLKEEFEDKGINLSFYDSDDEYRDNLAAEGKVMVISVYDTDIKEGSWARIAKHIEASEKAGFRTLLLTASSPDLASELMAEIGEESRSIIEKHIYFSDYKTLITLNRSNGGATYFSNGKLICKWAFRSFPDSKALDEVYRDNDTEESLKHNTGKDLAFQGFLLYVTAVMLLL